MPLVQAEQVFRAELGRVRLAEEEVVILDEGGARKDVDLDRDRGHHDKEGGQDHPVPQQGSWNGPPDTRVPARPGINWGHARTPDQQV